MKRPKPVVLGRGRFGMTEYGVFGLRRCPDLIRKARRFNGRAGTLLFLPDPPKPRRSR